VHLFHQTLPPPPLSSSPVLFLLSPTHFTKELHLFDRTLPLPKGHVSEMVIKTIKTLRGDEAIFLLGFFVFVVGRGWREGRGGVGQEN